jgi:hypothetical protein
VGCLQKHIHGCTNVYKLVKVRCVNHWGNYLLCRVIWGSPWTSTRTTTLCKSILRGCLLSDCIRCATPREIVTIVCTVFMPLSHTVTTLFLTIARIGMMQNYASSQRLPVYSTYFLDQPRIEQPHSLNSTADMNLTPMKLPSASRT